MPPPVMLARGRVILARYAWPWEGGEAAEPVEKYCGDDAAEAAAEKEEEAESRWSSRMRAASFAMRGIKT